MRGPHRRRAPRNGALHFFWLLALTLSLLPIRSTGALSLGTGACAPDRIDVRSRVAYVYDGDTLGLADGTKVRLIGINTPELGRDGRRPEPLAIRARNRLQSLLEQGGNSVHLRYDVERRDHHGRTLAHAYLPDGRKLGALLLAEGLAYAIAVPPNLRHLDCHRSAEQRARRGRIGLWQPARAEPKAAASLTSADTGFRRVHGRVARVRRARDATWLHLPGSLVLRVDRADRSYFANLRLESLRGRTVVVRGWITGRGKRLFMSLRHPAAIEAVE